MSNVNESRPLAATAPRAPVAVQVLGYAGLVPFAAMAIIIAATGSNASGVIRAEIAYGAAMLSFLGGARWGMAIAAGGTQHLFRPLGLATLPTLFASLVLFMPSPTALVALIAGFVLLLIADRQDARAERIASWYWSLRLTLTLLALVALAISLCVVLLG